MQCWSEWSQNTPEPLWGTLCATVWSEWSQNTPEPRLGTLCVTVKSESWVLRQAREWRVRIFLALYCCQQVQHASPSFRQGGWHKTWRLRPSQYWLCLRAFAHKLCVFSYFWGDHSPLDMSVCAIEPAAWEANSKMDFDFASSSIPPCLSK